MKKLYIVVLVLIASALFESCQMSAPTEEDFGKVSIWPEIKKEHRPWSRWWWMGNAVDKKNIDLLLSKYSEVGIGGVEIAPIYGAKGYEEKYLDFLSPEWLEMLDFTVYIADSLNMGVDLTQGTGWPFGGPHITPQYAASRLFIQTYEVEAGKVLLEKIVMNDPKQKELDPVLQAVVAFANGVESVEITEHVDQDGTLHWSPPSGGTWKIYAAFNGRTRQKVKRAAPGGAGYTLDHLSKKSVEAYLKPFNEAFKNDNRGVRAFYNDSYEVYNADWSEDFLNEFEKRRGYKLTSYLKELWSSDELELVARVKGDYRETMSDLLLENFAQPWTEWAHQRKSITKNQAHGSPGNLLDLYAAVDIPECETFGSSYFPIPGLRRDSADIRNVDPDPLMLKFASSAGNVTGKELVSSETFTWLGEHFKSSFSQAKPELEQVFLSGVNHVFYHGITYSPVEVEWPGWLFYASLNLTPANSLWPHFKGLNDYIARCQSILQSGQPDNELLVYWPVYDIYNHPDKREKMISVHGVDKWLHPTQFYKQSLRLMDAGYSLDFISDRMIEDSKISDGKIAVSTKAPEYSALIIPKAKFIPHTTIESALELAKEGATVIFEDFPEDVPGLYDLEARRDLLKSLIGSVLSKTSQEGLKEAKIGKGTVIITKDIQKALQYKGIQRERLRDTGLKFIRRDMDYGKYYYLVNHTPEIIDTSIPLNMKAEAVVIMDPQSGNTGLAPSIRNGNETMVRVQMKPGEAIILRATHHKVTGLPQWDYLVEGESLIALDALWELKFKDGGPTLPKSRTIQNLVSWTDIGESDLEVFSGTGVYSTSFRMDSKNADEYILDLGKVNESARVWVNDEEVGLLWSIPFEARIGQYLKEGENTIKVEVANLMANRIRDLDIRGIEWRKYHEINFVNIDYKAFDASGWKPMASGLLGPVVIKPHKVIKH